MVVLVLVMKWGALDVVQQPSTIGGLPLYPVLTLLRSAVQSRSNQGKSTKTNV